MSYSDTTFIIDTIVMMGVAFVIILLLWISGFFHIKSQSVYETLSTTPGIVNVVEDPEIKLEAACSNNNPDLNNCEQFKYKLMIKGMGIKYDKEPFDMVITVAAKDFDQPVNYKINSQDLAKYHRADFGEQGAIIDVDDIAFFSSRPPILNFAGRTEYSSPIWNQQTVRVGDYTVIGYTSFLSTFRSMQDII